MSLAAERINHAHQQYRAALDTPAESAALDELRYVVEAVSHADRMRRAQRRKAVGQ